MQARVKPRPVAVRAEAVEHGSFGDAVVTGDKREHALVKDMVGNTVALRDRIYRVYDVVCLDDGGDVRGMLRLEERATSR